MLNRLVVYSLKSGWKPYKDMESGIEVKFLIKRVGRDVGLMILTVGNHGVGEEMELNTIIFNHDWCRCLFGNFRVCGFCGRPVVGFGECKNNDCLLRGNVHVDIPNWEYQLQRQSVMINPLVYQYELSLAKLLSIKGHGS
jgi:hypothetical protein